LYHQEASGGLSMVKALVIDKDKGYSIEKVKQKGEKRYLPKKIQTMPIEYDSTSIIDEKVPWYKPWKKGDKLIIHFQGSKRSLKVNIDRNELSVDLGFLTMDDIVKVVKAEVVRALTSFKPIKLSYFLILAVLVIVNIFITFFIANRMGLL
jgi:hypothetical protein